MFSKHSTVGIFSEMQVFAFSKAEVAFLITISSPAIKSLSGESSGMTDQKLAIATSEEIHSNKFR